jgi:GTPase involved in cell partitioning and DNA repair
MMQMRNIAVSLRSSLCVSGQMIAYRSTGPAGGGQGGRGGHAKVSMERHLNSRTMLEQTHRQRTLRGKD